MTRRWQIPPCAAACSPDARTAAETSRLSARIALARGLSIIGHPLIVMPLATALAAVSRGADRAAAGRIVLGIAVLGTVLAGYTLWQVRRGHWAHMDASRHDERRQLNRALLIALGLAAAWTWHRDGGSPTAVALTAGTGIVLLAMLTTRWTKLSLHVAFAVFAACLPAWPMARVALLALAVAIAWSRLALARHNRFDLAVGAAAGALAGFAFTLSANSAG